MREVALCILLENQVTPTNTISSSNEGLSCQFALNKVLSSNLITLSQDLWYEKEKKKVKAAPRQAPTLKELFLST